MEDGGWREGEGEPVGKRKKGSWQEKGELQTLNSIGGELFIHLNLFALD